MKFEDTPNDLVGRQNCITCDIHLGPAGRPNRRSPTECLFGSIPAVWVLTFNVLLVSRNNLLGVFARQKEPLRRVAEVVILGGQVFGEGRSLVGRGQPVRERTEQPVLRRMLVPVEAISGGENVIVKLHHRQDGRVE